MQKRTVRELVKCLGGSRAVADRMNTTPRNVANWVARNRVAGRYVLPMYLLIQERKIDVDLTVLDVDENGAPLVAPAAEISHLKELAAP
ncbi:MAG: hypothetical protein AAGG72_04100 [Pseudomonadota bacterium]